MSRKIKGGRMLRAVLVVTLFCALAPAYSFAQTCGLPGNDGPVTASGVVNTYFPPANASETVTAGATSIPLGAADTANGGATTPIAIGDLVLIIQVQDATINTTNGTAYGANNGTGSGYTGGTVGAYEFAVATSAVPISGGTLTVSAGLKNTYASAAASGTQGEKSFQVVRVPQYSSVTLGTLQAAPWDGNAGGIVAIDVAGTLNLGGGTIDASGRGFRGGGGLNQSGGTTGTNTDYRDNSTVGWGGSKGEGIAGTPRYTFNAATNTVVDNTTEGYPNGSFMRGAPGNAGGGGNDGDPANNDQNSGGGGGGNGGAGGVGGNTWSSGYAYGGKGGSAYTGSATKIVMGGGGGAGTANNSSGYLTSGAAGGGIVIVRAGSVSGAGTINANGANALDIDQDGAGGGGAGGSVVVTVKAGNSLAGLTITANGGNGGDTWPNYAPGTSNINEHGPGGGGGGGVVYQSGGATVSVAGGAHGTSTTSLLQFGSANGSTGISGSATASSPLGAASGAACVPVLTVTKSTSTANVLQGATATYTITVTNAAGVAGAQQVKISDPLPQPVTPGFTYASTGTVTLNGGATRPTTTNPNVGDATPIWGVYTIPANGSVAITFTVNLAYLVPPATYQNSATATYLDPARTTATGTTTSSYNASSSTAEDVTVSTAIAISGNVFADVNHNGTLDTGESWTNGVTVYVNLVSGTTLKQSVQVTAGTGAYSFSSVIPGTYTVVLTNSATSTTATVPSGWLATAPSTASLSLTTGSSSLVGQNFGLFAGSKVTGSAFIDNGAGGGTANDGKLNGSEKGLASVPIVATNGSSITYDSTTTDTNGAFTLWIPNTAASVVIDETVPTGYIATGGDVGTSGGTYSRTNSWITFTYSTSASYTGLRFGQVPVNTFVADNALAGAPGTSVLYPHTFTALSAGQVMFSTTATSSTPSWFTEVIFRDTDCSGTLTGTDTPLTAAVTVNAGDKVCIIVKDMIASTAGYDAVNAITVTAQFTYTSASPSLSATYTRSDTTTVSNASNSGLRLIKTVDKSTAKSGDTLLYTITYSNVSSGAVSNIVVADSTPSYTTFISAACGSLPTGITACNVSTQPSSGGTGSIKWTLTGSLASSASGQVTFSVRIQ